MSQREAALRLTRAEAAHVAELLLSAIERGDYYGNRSQYWQRHERLMMKLKLTQQSLEAMR